MNPATFIICAFNLCFNPSQITYMETQHISGDCKVHFASRDFDTITVDTASCEELAAEINKQLSEKSAK